MFTTIAAGRCSQQAVSVRVNPFPSFEQTAGRIMLQYSIRRIFRCHLTPICPTPLTEKSALLWQKTECPCSVSFEIFKHFRSIFFFLDFFLMSRVLGDTCGRVLCYRPHLRILVSSPYNVSFEIFKHLRFILFIKKKIYLSFF